MLCVLNKTLVGIIFTKGVFWKIIFLASTIFLLVTTTIHPQKMILQLIFLSVVQRIPFELRHNLALFIQFIVGRDFVITGAFELFSFFT